MQSIKKNISSVLIGITIFLSSCVWDWNAGIVIVKNCKPKNRILVAKQPGDLMTDSILFNERFSENLIYPMNSQIIVLPNTKLSSKQDNEKVHLYVFNCDSLDKYQQLKEIKGILKHSFIQKIEIQLNKVKEPLDTIYIR
jgi:hypothetical protein